MKNSFNLFLLVILLVHASNFLMAQENTNDKKFSLSISLTGNLSFGNSERILLINNADINWLSKSDKTKYISKIRYVYGTVGGFLKENDFRTGNYLMLNADKKLSPLVALYFETLRLKKINTFLKPMVGIQYKLIDHPKFNFNPRMLIGYSWQNYDGSNFSNFDNNGNSTINGSNLNFGFMATINPFKDKVIFDLFSNYQYGLEESKNQRLWLDVVMRVPLHKGLSFNLMFNNYYEEIILNGVKQNDITLTYGLSYRF